MEELRKRRDDLFHEKVSLTMELKKVSELLKAAEIHLSNGRYEENQREEEK